MKVKALTQSANGMAAHYVYDHSGERVLKTIAYGGLATVNNRGNVVMAMESPTVYVNPYYIATPYQEAQLVSKHYYMGSQRVASSVTDLSPQPWGTPPSGEEYEIPNQSTAADAVIMDFVETMNCVFNDQIQFGFGDMLSIPQLDEIAFVDCEEGTVIEDVEPFLTENLQCACEQGTYWVSQNGFNCNEVNVMYCCSAAETPWEALAEFRGYHPDYLGSVEAVTNADGEVYQFFHNTIWGEPLQQQKAFLFNSFSSRFRFNGKESDWETGNYYYGARYYDPRISVWLGVDPLANEFHSWSPYNFTVNNPLNLIDPNGMAPTKLPMTGEQLFFQGWSEMFQGAARFFDKAIGRIKKWFSISKEVGPGTYVGAEAVITIEGTFEEWMRPTYNNGVKTVPVIIDSEFSIDFFTKEELSIPTPYGDATFEHKTSLTTGEQSYKSSFGPQRNGVGVSAFIESTENSSGSNTETRVGVQATVQQKVGSFLFEAGIESSHDID